MMLEREEIIAGTKPLSRDSEMGFGGECRMGWELSKYMTEALT